MFRRARIAVVVFAALAAAVALAACGDDDDGGTRATPAPSTASAVVEAALLEAVNEEYKAHATYQAVIDKLGEVGPFPNIVKSEQTHIDAWKSSLAKYGKGIPQDPFLGEVAAPATLKEASAAGVEAEKPDVAPYDRLLKVVIAPDIVNVMEQQRKVSQENHLPAFERC